MGASIYKVRGHYKTPYLLYPGTAVFAMWIADDANGYREYFNARRINPDWVLERNMTAFEREQFEHCCDLPGIVFKNFRELIGEEFLITEDMEWCAQLHKASNLVESLQCILDSRKSR